MQLQRHVVFDRSDCALDGVECCLSALPGDLVRTYTTLLVDVFCEGVRHRN